MKVDQLVRLAEPVPERVPATPGARWTSLLLASLAGLLLAFAGSLMLISPVQHRTAQDRLYGQLRLSLAEGSTPVSPAGADGTPLALGTPVAVFDFPTVGITREVAVEGSGPGQTMLGIGHRRDTVLPCQVGTAVVMARDGAFGGIGQKWKWLSPGDRFTVTMGQGTCTYAVFSQRVTGDTPPDPPTGRAARIVLTTAAGTPWMPTDVQRVDAQLVGTAFDRPDQAISTASLPTAEQAMGSDHGQLTGLVLLLQALALVGVASAWLWRRWDHARAWVAIVPPVTALTLLCAHSALYLLPNLL